MDTDDFFYYDSDSQGRPVPKKERFTSDEPTREVPNEDGSCRLCSAVPAHPETGLCSACTDEQEVRRTAPLAKPGAFAARAWHDVVRDAIDLDVYGYGGAANETQIHNVAKRIAAYAAGRAVSGAQQVVWFHGTSPENAAIIERDGFKEGTWLARHMEDAIEFGGPCVFWVNVKFDRTPLEWQVCTSNALPASSISKYIHAAAPAMAQAQLSEEQVRAAVEAFNRIDGGSYAALTAKFNALLRPVAAEGNNKGETT